MKKSLSDFAQTPLKETPTQTPPKRENIEEIVNQYQNMPRDELMQNFYTEVAKQKANGTFNLARLEQSIDSLSAFLSPEQKKNIKEILKNL